MQMCDIVISRSHGIKGGNTDEVFKAPQENCFLRERGASVCSGFKLFLNFKTFYMHKNLYNTEGKGKKMNMSPFKSGKKMMFQRGTFTIILTFNYL